MGLFDKLYEYNQKKKLQKELEEKQRLYRLGQQLRKKNNSRALISGRDIIHFKIELVNGLIIFAYTLDEEAEVDAEIIYTRDNPNLFALSRLDGYMNCSRDIICYGKKSKPFSYVEVVDTYNFSSMHFSYSKVLEVRAKSTVSGDTSLYRVKLIVF